MKVISRKSLIVLLAAVLMLVSSVGMTVAYFSDNDSAEGQAALSLKPDTTIHEGDSDTQKLISISNSETGAPVIVRVRIYGPGEALLTETINDNNWAKASDGWYYYKKALAPGASTGTILAELKADLPDEEKTQLGDEFNVTVVHEAAVVVYDGSTIKVPAGWGVSAGYFTE